MKIIDASLGSQIEGRRGSLWREAHHFATSPNSLLSHQIANSLRGLAWLYDLQNQVFFKDTLPESIMRLEALALTMDALAKDPESLALQHASTFRLLQAELPLATANPYFPNDFFDDLRADLSV